jgi:hypothetical protein
VYMCVCIHTYLYVQYIRIYVRIQHVQYIRMYVHTYSMYMYMCVLVY